MNKRVDRGAATRQQIIEAATQLFSEQGYEASAVENLLGRLPISRGALYHHFRSKDVLFEAVLETVEARLAASIVAASSDATDPVMALKAGCGAFLHAAQDPVVRQIVLIDALGVVGWAKWREMDARYGFGLLKASLDAIALAGKVRPEMTGILAHLLLASLIEAALVAARAPHPAQAVELSRSALDHIVDALFERS